MISDSVIVTRTRTLRDTLVQVASRDSVREVPVEVEVVREVKYVPWWYRYPAYIGWVALGILILYAALLIARATIR